MPTKSPCIAFDTALKEVRPFSSAFSATDTVWNSTKAYGATSLWDAIAETSQKISDRQRRRALVVITDGVDSASTLKPSDVSAIASSLDVPVYMLVITFALDDTDVREAPIRGTDGRLRGMDGRRCLAVRDPLSMLDATRPGFSASSIISTSSRSSRARRAGWHALVLRARKQGLFVRARSGYMVQ